MFKSFFVSFFFVGVCSIALASAGDPPCAPIDPQATEQVDWLRETENVVLFSDVENTESYSTSVIGDCRARYLDGSSPLNCLYVSHQHLPELLQIIDRDEIKIKGVFVSNASAMDDANAPILAAQKPYEVISLSSEPLGGVSSAEEIARQVLGEY